MKPQTDRPPIPGGGPFHGRAHTMDRKYLLGHVDEATAYVVNDYPYGFTLRTSIRYWIETTKRGSRFVSQTLNPKNGLWNTPKKSTYLEFGAALYLNDEGHVKHWGLSLYAGPDSVLEFLRDAPSGVTRDLRDFVIARKKLEEANASGALCWTVNGVRRETPAAEREQSAEDARKWAECLQMLDSLACAAE